MLQGPNRKRPDGLHATRLVALFAAGCLLFSFPLLSLFEGPGRPFGLPLLPAALFVLWALLICALAWISARGDD